ncbi:protein SpAN-like [Dreissena polymorpha]|uniref:protein SpAN-like n=1 Tax=Dreissena polymorpha TaxID=45954 RepID=UPI002263B0BB|nr:protein SpAN-like [Dreissena polymorpha]
MARLESTLYLLLPLLNYLAKSTGESISECFTGEQKTLRINCGSGYMLRITNTFYGFSNSNTCSFRAGDCTQLEHTPYPCTGRDSCLITVPRSGKRLDNCDKNSTYFQVQYTCDPVIETTDICQSSVLTAQRGYISTPRFPSNYRDNLDCLTRIRVDPSQQINLTVIDMDLEINGTYGCKDWMYAFNQYRSVTLCGLRFNEKLTTLQSNEISIKFQSNELTNKKGFWILYEAWPPLIPSQPSTTERLTVPPQITTSPEVQTTKIAPLITSNTAVSNTKEEKLPFVAIVSSVIGTLTFILIVLLIILVYRWWNDKKDTSYKRKSQDVEYLDTRNPAYRSSTGTEFSGVEIYYNR